VVVAIGTRTRDPDVPDGEKPFPVPLQAVALVLVQVSVVDSGYHIEVGDAERVTAAWLTSARAELTACPETTSRERRKPSLIVVNTVILNMRLYLQRLELDLTRSVWR